MKLKLFKISQNQNQGYDTYDSAIVCAEDESAARGISPYDGKQIDSWKSYYIQSCWCSSIEHVTCEYIGDAVPGIAAGLILSSFNAG